MMKNAFYFMSKALFVLKVFRFLSRLFGHVKKQLDQKDQANVKIYEVTSWEKSNFNTHIDHYLQK